MSSVLANEAARALLHHSLVQVGYEYDGLSPEEQAIVTREQFNALAWELKTYCEWFIVEVRKDKFAPWEAWSIRQRGYETFNGDFAPGDRQAVANGAGVALVDVRLRPATPKEVDAIEKGVA